MAKEEPSVFSLNNHPNVNKMYSIVPLCAPDMSIDIAGARAEDDTNVIIYKSHSDLNQRFKFEVNNNLDCFIIPCHCKNKVVDVKYSEVKNGTNIHLWSKNGTKAQLFRIIKSGDDCYTFLSSLNYRYCIDVNKSGTKNGTNIQLFARNYTNAQKFKLIGQNDISSAIEYALKYAEEPSPKYKIEDNNASNFCSQCLVAGGEDENDVWNKNTDAFKDDRLLREHFNQKGIPWVENANIKEIESGDIVYTKKESDTFSGPVFVIKKIKNGIIYCGNNLDIKSKGILKLNEAPGLLKTSNLFN